MAGTSFIDWTANGARFGLGLPRLGEWEVIVPKEVVVEGWKAETGAAETSETELFKWVDQHYLDFAEMVAGRIDGRYSERSDDPRVIAKKL